MNPLIFKTIGVGGAAILLTDALQKASRKGIEETNKQINTDITDIYIKHQSSSADSTFLEGIKGWYRSKMLDDNFVTQLVVIKNTIFSGVKEIAKYSVPIALAAGAIFTPPIIAAGCAAVLVVGGAGIFLKEVMGIGQESTIK